MLQRLKNFFATIRLKRVLLVSTLASLALLLLLIATIAALPSLLSTPAAQAYLRSSLSKALQRQVAWTELHLSWSKGLALKGLSLGAGPAPLLQLTMEEISLLPKAGFRDGRLRLDLALRCGNIFAAAAPGAPKPPKPYQEPLTAIAAAVQKFEKLDWPLPLDLGVTVAIEPVNLTYKDPKSGRSLALDNLAFRFDMPSLADKPLAVELSSGLVVDGHRLEPLSLRADLRQLVTTSRRIHPAGALVTVKSAMPGSSLALSGGVLAPEGFAVKALIDLPRLMVAAGPFLQKSLPRLQGELALDLLARVDGAQNLHASLQLEGSRLAFSGGRLRQGRVGPLHISLRQKMVSDRQKEQVRFIAGGAKVDKLLEAAWEATVDRPSRKDRDLTAQLGPVRVDLQQGMAIAGPLLSKKFPLKELTGELTLQQLLVRLQGRKKTGEITLAGLGISSPRARLALNKGGVTTAGVNVAISTATVPLAGMQPTRVDASLAYSLTSFALGGAQPIVANGLSGSLQLALTGLKLKSSSPRRVVASAELKQTLDLQRLGLEGKLTVADLHQQLLARIMAKESGEIEITLPELKIAAASLQAKAVGKQLAPLPLTAVITASGIRLAAVRGVPPVVERAACTLTGGDFLQLSATAALSGGQRQLASSDGTLRVELERILPLAAPFLPKGAAASGVTSLSWSLAAPTVQPPLPKGRNPLARARAAAAMVEHGEIAISLANRAVSWPLQNGKLVVADLHTSQPLKVVLPGKSGKITVAGTIGFAGLGGLSGAAKKLPLQSGSITLNGELLDWQVLKLHQELNLQPLSVAQKADATISRIDRLGKQDAITTAVLLQQLDAVVTAAVEADFPGQPTPVPGGAELSGEGSARVRLNLAAGRELKLQATAATRDFGVKLANGTAVEGVHADLLVERSYSLARNEVVDWTPLSASLLRPTPEPSAVAGGAEIVSRVREDLRGQGSASRKFFIRKLVSRSGDTPLELTSLEGDLLLTPEEAGLSFFQAELLGGTVRLRSMIDLTPEIPTVSAACSFSNLATYLLLPPETRKKSGKTEQDTEITGEVSMAAPLETRQRELLEGFRMRLNLRKIGANTLERALFGLDPNERNEQIVKLRKQLRYGSLQVLRASSLDGAFSLDGEVKVKGVNIDLPKVERLRLSELPIQKQMAKTLAGIASLRKILELLRADTLFVGPKGNVSLVRRGHE